MAKDFIVAIELGSSRIIGIAGKKNVDGSMSILSVVTEDATSYIRKGVIYNIDKIIICLNNIIKKLETALHYKIGQVYVGVGGQSLHSVRNVIIKDLPEETIVTQDMVNELMDANRSMSYPEQEILDAVTQEYKVDQQYQLDPVGIQCKRLESNFLNILWRDTFYKNLNKCFESAGIRIAEMYLSPLVLADNVLTETEKRSGCVLVDLGAATTTVSVYYKNILRHLVVIPLGGENITKDIASLQIEDEQAEKLKLKYASAYTENTKIDDKLHYNIDDERQIESRKFIEIVEARVEEIIHNVWNQVPQEYADKLIGGFILTGGGANLPNMEKAFVNVTSIGKIRVAKSIHQTINASQPEIKAQDGRMNTALSLIETGNMNCAGEEIKTDLFQEPTQNPANNPTSDNGAEARKTQNAPGHVQTEEEKKRLEEERKRKEEQEKKKAEEETAQPKDGNKFRKMVEGVKNFISKLTEED